MWWYPHTEKVLTWQANREVDKSTHNVPGKWHTFFIGKMIGYHVLKVCEKKKRNREDNFKQREREREIEKQKFHK